MKTTFLLGILLMIGSAAHAQSGKVTIYRTFRVAGHTSVFCDGKEVAKLGTKEFVELQLPAGRHYCTAFKSSDPGQGFDLVEGQSPYFDVRLAAHGTQAIAPMPVEAFRSSNVVSEK